MDSNGLLYEKIIQYLEEKINKKELLPGDRLPTEMELAQEFGVSRITSKRALEELRASGLIYRIRGKGSFVAQPEQAVIPSDKANGELEYSKIIVLVIPFSASSGGMMTTIRGVSQIASQKGYILDIKYSNNDLDEERVILEQVYEKGVGGIIFYPISDGKNLEVMNMLCMNEFPIVSIDRYYDSLPISYVISDNFQGEYEATKYLLSLGHRNIAFVSDTRIEDATSVRNRYFGYCKALKERGIQVRADYVINGSFRNETKRESLSELLEKGITAICCVNDYVALIVLQGLNNLEVDVPGEISVVGFDNLDISEVASVPLTTINQDMARMGEAAARYIVDSIESGKYNYMREVIPVELVPRESCKNLNDVVEE